MTVIPETIRSQAAMGLIADCNSVKILKQILPPSFRNCVWDYKDITPHNRLPENPLQYKEQDILRVLYEHP